MTAFFESGDTGAVLGAKLRQDASFGKMGGEEDCTGRFVLFPPETGIDTALFTGFTAVRQAERCSRSTRYVNNMQYDRAKGENSMRIAVTYEDGQVFQHFGHTREFKVYDVEDGEVRSAQVAETNGAGHGALAGVLSALNAGVLICGGIGGGAQATLAEAGIQIYGGVSGGADEAVASFLAGTLAYDPDVRCSHHGEHHHQDGECGGHSCGEHTCGGQ